MAESDIFLSFLLSLLSICKVGPHAFLGSGLAKDLIVNLPPTVKLNGLEEAVKNPPLPLVLMIVKSLISLLSYLYFWSILLIPIPKSEILEVLPFSNSYLKFTFSASG